jgi:hypothetical protein
MSQEYYIIVLESGSDSFVPDTEQIITNVGCNLPANVGMFIFFMGEKNEE